MSIGFIFWLLMLLWLIFGFVRAWPAVPTESRFGFIGNSLFEFILFFLLGWKVFGFIIQG